MPTKLIIRWDVREEVEDSEYYEFLVHEFIPGMSKLGLADIQVWATAFGECEQKLVTGVTQSVDHMNDALDSEEWMALSDKLEKFVNPLGHKVIKATNGFQI